MTRSRRVLHFVAAVMGMAVASPLFLLVALAVKIGDGGPVFFRQERVGYRGRRFRIWKFRTMAPNADRMGIQLTTASDPRVTATGRWLRRLKIDELPQLLNVLSGEMALVGPRPDVPRYVARYTPAQAAVLDFVPGITDPASLVFRNESELLASAGDAEAVYYRDILPEKLRISIAYAGRATAWSDVKVLFLTLAVLLPGLGGVVDRQLRWLSGRQSIAGRAPLHHVRDQ